jgi:hypothetical protein
MAAPEAVALPLAAEAAVLQLPFLQLCSALVVLQLKAEEVLVNNAAVVIQL